MRDNLFDHMAREEIKGLPIYSPGMDIEEVKRTYGVQRVIKLASNENPCGPSPKAIKAIIDAVSQVNLYPDGSCFELRKSLSEKLNIASECLVFGNGADEIIDFLFYAFFRPSERVIMGEPTFSSFFLSGMMMGAKVIFVPLVDFRHPVEEIVKAVDEKTRAIFIGSPHNPTGTICSEDEFKYLLKRIPDDVLLVWDEAYGEYVEDPSYPDAIPYLSEYPNLVILRTFSKIYGLAGLRIGYGIASPQVVEYIERVRPPFNVNRLAQVAALAALEDEEHVRRSKKTNSEGRRFLASELNRLGFEVVPSQANFILFRYDHLLENLTERLLERGIIVRDGVPLGCPGFIRLTVGKSEENVAVISAIEDILRGRGCQ